MDVARPARPFRLALLIAGLHLAAGAIAHADPMYTAIDLGTGNPTYGTDSSGNGTVTGSNGQSYIFNPAQSYLPSQWASTSVGVPIVQPAPDGAPLTYGNPLNAYSYSSLGAMNSQGVAAGINFYGVNGHLGWAEAFITQRQADGSWGTGTPIPLWQGAQGYWSQANDIGINGVSANGQVLGYGVYNPESSLTQLFLYDTNTHALINMTSLLNAMTWTNSSQLAPGQIPNWILGNPSNSQIDAQGRLLVQATEGLSGSPHNLLMVPDSLPGNQVPAPEPASWAAFAMLIGGWMIHHRTRSRSGR